MEKRRLLISYAHPDDESFGLGGLIHKYVDEGVDVYLICATNGEAGSMDEEFLADGKTVKQVRLEELDCAAKKLRLKHVYTFGYRDSGMMGSEDNDHPDCLWKQWHLNPEKVTDEVVQVMREIRPHVVITFNEYGAYGHPDHISIQRATVAAMELVNDPNYITDAFPPYQPQKLYYSGISKFPVQLGIALSRLRGKDPRKLGRNQDIDAVAIVENIDAPTTKVDIRQYYPQWDEVNACHASQGGGRILPLSSAMRRILFPTQEFTRIYPPAPNKIIEQDLFEGVQVEENAAVITS